MLGAHRQAWAWQDEWFGLAMEDIREIERQTQLALQKKMGHDASADSFCDEDDGKSTNCAPVEPIEEQPFCIFNWLQLSHPFFLFLFGVLRLSSLDEILTVEILERSTSDPTSKQSQFNSIEKTEENSTPLAMKRPSVPINIPTVRKVPASMDASSDEEDDVKKLKDKVVSHRPRNAAQLGDAKHYFGSKGALPSPLGSAHSFDMQVNIINYLACVDRF